VPVEAARVEREPDGRVEHEGADVERRASRTNALEPRLDRRVVGRLDRQAVERSDAVVEQDPVSLRQSELCGRLEGVDLPEPSVDRGVASRSQLEPVERALKREPAAVDGRRFRAGRGLRATTRSDHHSRLGRHAEIVAPHSREPSKLLTRSTKEDSA
jgi:hypothetical protein